MEYTKKEQAELRSYLTPTQPLGPINAALIRSPIVSSKLFEAENEIYRNIIKRPSIVIGRRGSGKTSFLKHLKDEEYSTGVAVEVNIANAINKVAAFLKGIPEGLLPPTETVASIWDWLFWTSLLENVRTTLPNSFKCAVSTQSIIDRMKVNFDTFIFGSLGNLAEAFARSDTNAASIAGSIVYGLTDFDEEKLEQIQSDVKYTLKRAECRAIILVDSLDHFRQGSEVHDLAIAGLLKSAGGFNAVAGRPEIRLCLPSELFHYFYNLSSNLTKDFSNDIKLHWHPRELLNVAAHRYKIFLKCYQEDIEDSHIESLLSKNIQHRQGGIDFWREILPIEIINKYGIAENTISYIFRHTHLLPRQLIIYMNQMIHLNWKTNRSYTTITPEVVVSAISNIEHKVWGEVCNAYKPIYPMATAVCKATVSHLPLIFKPDELHDIYNAHVKRLINTNIFDFRSFERMMIEIGCIGIVRNDTSSVKYTEADFEYNNAHQLVPNNESLYCLHPMFCGVRQQSKQNKDIKVVMPFGNSPDAEDLRDRF